MSDESGSPRNGFTPRPEAKPFSWDKLTADQQKTVEDIHDWLVEYVTREPEPRGEQEAPLGWSIDQDRPSNVLLIDGGRGSGKTSVLLSLLHLWEQRLGKNSDEAAKAWKPLLENLERLKGRLIPVQVLDLQPLPPSTSLRTWIAGRLLTLAAHNEETKTKEAGIRRSSLFSAEEEPGWRKAWRDLLQDAAAGWHQGGGPNRDKLDPETLAVELEQAEFARLTIVDHWRKFVDEVVRSVSTTEHIEANARIIIPIDDADMNPSRCVELLDLIRTLWHSRVVFLLTGHSALFLKTLTLHFLGVFRAQLGGQAISALERSVIEDREPTADDLAHQVYDKVLPPRQRFQLNALTPTEQLRLLADVLDVRLRKPETPIRPIILRDFFALNPYVRPVLPDRLRKLQSLRQEWERARADEPLAAVLVYRFWRDAFTDERYYLSSADSRWIESMVVLEDGRIQIRDMNWRFQRRSNRTKHFQFQGESYLLRLTEAAGFVYPISIGDKDIYLPNKLTAALLLAVDLFIEERDERFDLLSPMPSGFDHDLVRNELFPSPNQSRHMGVTVDQQSIATWPLPDWRTSLDFAIFDGYWNEALKSPVKTQEHRLGFIAFSFLRAVLATYKRVPDMKPLDVDVAPDWEALARELVETTRELEHQPNRTERDNTFLGWLLGRAILLAAPESGLPPDSANKLLTAWLGQFKHKDDQLQERAIQAARTERQGQATRMNRRIGNVSEFIDHLDSNFPHHQWARKIEMHGKEGVSSLQDVIGDTLSRFSVHQMNSNLSEPRNLREYMHKLKLNIPVTPYFAKRVRRGLEDLSKTNINTLEALTYLWRHLASEFHPEKHELRNLLNQAFTNEHPVSTIANELRIHPEQYEHTKIKKNKDIITDKHETKLRLYELGPLKQPDELAQLLLLAHDVAVDTTDHEPSWLRESGPDINYFTFLPHAETLIRFKNKNIRLSWPAPRWSTFLDCRLEDDCMTKALAPIETQLENGETLDYFKRVLAACLNVALFVSVGIGDRRDASPSLDVLEQNFESWRSTGARIRHIFSSDLNSAPKDNRSRIVRHWARAAVPLYATPEMGLPVKFAKGLLAGWMGAQHDTLEQKPLPPLGQNDYGPRIEDHRRLRHNWISRCLHQSGLSVSDSVSEAHRFLQEIDRQNPNHPWHQVFGAEPDTDSAEET